MATAKVVVATTVALSFISFWRGAAIVLSDLASTMFYVGGIVERAIGKPAPWFVIGVMLFSFAVRSVYMESCSMFVRGGVYVVVRDSLGPFMGKLSVSALVVDYVLTGPISSVSAGQYLGRLFNELSGMAGMGLYIDPNGFATFFGVGVTSYFWWMNTKGIHESSGKALRIMQITTVMVVILLIWCPVTLLWRGDANLPPAPVPENLRFDSHSLGWLQGTFWPQLAGVAIIIAFGHSLLAMSGFETLAQVYREIAYPKLKNLKITANIVCTYALLSTGLISLFAVMIIPDSVRPQYYDNLIGGLAMSLAGPELLKLVFHTFVVIVGGLILSGAVNTAIIGANGVLNRVAEDGVLLNWFRKPHRRFGTTYRIINLITLLQVATILASRGDVYLLGEAYAFGVVWSFFLKGVGVLALRFQRHDQEYKTPLNLHIRGVEIPIGLGLTTLLLFLVAMANLLTKQVATVYGVSFTVVLFSLFIISERISKTRRTAGKQALEEFNLDHQRDIESRSLRARPGCVLVAVRDYTRMDHFRRVLQKTNVRRHDIVVMTVRQMSAGAGEYGLTDQQLFSDYEQELFSHVVEMAEKEGKTVELLVVPAEDPFDAMVQAAAALKASRLVTGVSARMASEELARRIGLAWERLPEPRHAFSLEIISPDRDSTYVNLGPHPPRLWPEDVDRLHELWLQLGEEEGLGSKLHHRDVVGVALRLLGNTLSGPERNKVLEELRRELRRD
ncbi:MAG: APC family permease [Bryobacterales bacterium]|nr:APC family permease [Bryobacterales bacterium]MEB2362156.1 APC family permease [Bryobacterales bacterium]